MESEEVTAAHTVPPLNLASQQVSYKVRGDDFEIVKWLWKHFTDKTGVITYGSFFKLINRSLYEFLKSGEKTINIPEHFITPSEDKMIKEIKLLRAQVRAGQLKLKETKTIPSDDDSAHQFFHTAIEPLQKKITQLENENASLKEAKAGPVTDVEPYQNRIAELEDEVALLKAEKESTPAPAQPSNGVLLDVSSNEMQQFERATARRIAGQRSASRENFIYQMFTYLRQYSTKVHLLRDED